MKTKETATPALADSYSVLSTQVLEFLRAFTLVIHHAGKATRESREEFRAITLELILRQKETK